MPRQPRCSICTDAIARVAVAELRAQNVSYQHIANRLGLAKASVGRHCVHAKLSPRDAPPSSGRKSAQAGRVRRGGRCQTCGTVLDDPSPSALVKRAERVLAFGEQIMQKAIEDEDFRLALQAVDRARASLEQLMKVHGLLSDGAGAVVDNRKQVIQVLANLTEDQLRALVAAGTGALGDVTDNRALSAGSESSVIQP